MNLKNYTLEMPVEKSMAIIERNLVSAGATKIMKDYDAHGNCTNISFSLIVNQKLIAFQISAKVEAIYKILVGQYKKPTERSFEICKDQAGRTAWKLISDWVSVQISMVKLEQAELLQVFLPFMHDGTQSMYDKISKNNFKLLNQ